VTHAGVALHGTTTGPLMSITQKISPCLWFADQAEEAARFYTGIFPNSRITVITRYGSAGFDVHHRPAGSVMVVAFELDGQTFTALNGGPVFTFNEAISLQVNCTTQDEIDHYWARLSEGGDPAAQQCGWLEDRYGVSWQIVPDSMEGLFIDENAPGTQRAMQAMLAMKKLDIAALRRALEVQGDVPLAQLQQVVAALALAPPPSLFTRCLLCNAALSPPLPPTDAARLVPPGVRELAGPVRVCPTCGRAYWLGSHARRMRAALERALPGWAP
jgi:predicted 3-demethylubiquinone-9 3-methyltransferase (glyoxalase superfamily)